MPAAKSAKLRFVTYTDCPAKQSKRDLKAVRSHVMHDYFNRQKPEDECDTPGPNNAKGRVIKDSAPNQNAGSSEQVGLSGAARSKTDLVCEGRGRRTHSSEPAFSIGCFQAELPKHAENGHSKNASGGAPYSRSRSHTPRSLDFLQPLKSWVSPDLNASITTNEFQVDVYSAKQAQSLFKRSLVFPGEPITDCSDEQSQQLTHGTLPNFQPCPGPLGQLVPCRYDPFDQLPANGRYVEELIAWHFEWPSNNYTHWEKFAPTLQVSTEVFKRGFWNMTSDNEGLFHIFLCLAEAKKAASTGQVNHVNYLYHRGRAIREMMRGIQNPDETPQGPLATLISSMAGLALSDDGNDAALIHTRAAVGIVMNRPKGLDSLSVAEWRSVVWNDLRVASAAFQTPMLPWTPLKTFAQLPDGMEDETLRLAKISMTTLPGLDFGGSVEVVRSIFQGLHQTCLLYDILKSPTPSIMAAFSNLLYTLEYRLCTLVAETCPLTHDGSQLMAGAFTVETAMLLALQMFAWSCIPSQFQVKIHMPPNVSVVDAKILRVLLQGLEEQTDGDVVSFWQNKTRLESLVWVLIVVHRVCLRDMPDRPTSWILEELEKVGRALGYTEKAEFARTFKSFPYATRVGTKEWPGLGQDFCEWEPQLMAT